MKNKTYSESNYPSGTWESIWIGQITKAIEEWRAKRFMDSWRSTKILYSWLPEEVKEEVKPKLEEIEAKFKSVGASQWALLNAHYSLFRIPDICLFNALLEIHAKIQSSLETHGWICKPVGASPQVKHKKEAWA